MDGLRPRGLGPTGTRAAEAWAVAVATGHTAHVTLFGLYKAHRNKRRKL